MSKLKQLTDNLYYYTQKSFRYSIGDDERQFGILFEVLDTRDFDEDADKDYPFVVSMGIIADQCHESFDEDGNNGDKITKTSLLLDCNGYMGTIPVDHVLTDSVTGSLEKHQGDSFKNLTEQFTCKQAKVVTSKHQWGTVAAQRGRECEFSYLVFASEAQAMRMIKYILKHRISILSMMIGFILDRPINLAGEDGWSMIGRMTYGKEYKHDNYSINWPDTIFKENKYDV